MNSTVGVLCMTFKGGCWEWFCSDWHIKPPTSLLGCETGWGMCAFTKAWPWVDTCLLSHLMFLNRSWSRKNHQCPFCESPLDDASPHLIYLESCFFIFVVSFSFQLLEPLLQLKCISKFWLKKAFHFLWEVLWSIIPIAQHYVDPLLSATQTSLNSWVPESVTAEQR